MREILEMVSKLLESCRGKGSGEIEDNKRTKTMAGKGSFTMLTGSAKSTGK
jgi:hypothetical protein